MLDPFRLIADPGTRLSPRLAPDAEPAAELLPEQRLVYAVLLRALADAGVRVPGIQLRPSRPRQAAARRWFHSEDCAVLCELVGLDVAQVRGLVE